MSAQLLHCKTRLVYHNINIEETSRGLRLECKVRCGVTLVKFPIKRVWQ